MSEKFHAYLSAAGLGQVWLLLDFLQVALGSREEQRGRRRARAGSPELAAHKS